MKHEVIKTILRFIIAVSVAVALTVTYDLFSFMQAALVGGVPRTPILVEILFQLWFFGSREWYPAWIPLLLIAVCTFGLGMLRNPDQ